MCLFVVFCLLFWGGGSGARLLGASVLGHGLGALRHGVLGQLARQQQAHGSLDLAARDGRLVVVLGQLGGLAGNALEHVTETYKRFLEARFRKAFKLTGTPLRIQMKSSANPFADQS